MYTCIYVCIYLYVYIYIYVCVCVCVCVFARVAARPFLFQQQGVDKHVAIYRNLFYVESTLVVQAVFPPIT